MAKAKAKVRIKGASPADKQNIALARKVNTAKAKAPVKKLTTKNEDTPEAKKTLPEKKAAAEEQFSKADIAAMTRASQIASGF